MQQHPLEEWLNKTKRKRSDFARSIGCSEPHLSLVARGLRGVSLELAHNIERETNRAVTTEKLREARAAGR